MFYVINYSIVNEFRSLCFLQLIKTILIIDIEENDILFSYSYYQLFLSTMIRGKIEVNYNETANTT